MKHKVSTKNDGRLVKESPLRASHIGIYDNDPDWLRLREKEPRSQCSACHDPIFTDEQGYTHKGTARMQRGTFAITDGDGNFTTDPNENENLKAELYICSTCWLSDPDLCAFFNKIGWRTR